MKKDLDHPSVPVNPEQELLERDRILDAITKIAVELMPASSLDAALPTVLRLAGEAIAADRVLFLHQGKAHFFGTMDEMKASKDEVLRQFFQMDTLVLPEV